MVSSDSNFPFQRVWLGKLIFEKPWFGLLSEKWEVLAMFYILQMALWPLTKIKTTDIQWLMQYDFSSFDLFPFVV